MLPLQRSVTIYKALESLLSFQCGTSVSHFPIPTQGCSLRNNFSFTHTIFPTIPHMNENCFCFDSMIVFDKWNLHRIGRCYPLNLPLWKYIYFTSCPVDMMSLNCPAFLCKRTIYSTQESSKRFFSSHDYVRFGHEHQPGSARVSKEFSPKQFSFEAAPLLSHIGDYLILSNLITPLKNH